MLTATLSSKYQLCIPKQVREDMHLEVGQKFLFMPKGKTLHLVPIRNIHEVKGLLKGANIKNIRERKDRV